MRIGWVNDFINFEDRPGGAQRATDYYKKAVPDGIELVDCQPGNVAQDCDAYILFLTKLFSDTELTFLSEQKYIRCGYDWWHQFERQSKWRGILSEKAKANVFVSPLHQRHFLDIYHTPSSLASCFVIPPPMEPDEYVLNAVSERNGRAIWAAEWHPYKGPDLAARWAENNKIHLDMFSPSIPASVEHGSNFMNGWTHIEGFIKESERIKTWAQYSRFVHFNRYPDAFGYAILEAWLLGLYVTISGATGVESFGLPFTEVVALCEKAPQDFWKLAERYL